MCVSSLLALCAVFIVCVGVRIHVSRCFSVLMSHQLSNKKKKKTGKIMKVIKRWIIVFFQFVKWITHNTAVGKMASERKEVGQTDGGDSAN